MESTPAGATRMGSRSSTRHGGPAQVFVGPVRKWRKVWSPVVPSSPSTSATRVLLYKWSPLAPPSNGVKEDSGAPEQTTISPAWPVSVVIQRRKDEMAREAEELAEAQELVDPDAEDKKQATEEKTTDMVVDPKLSGSVENEEQRWCRRSCSNGSVDWRRPQSFNTDQ